MHQESQSARFRARGEGNGRGVEEAAAGGISLASISKECTEIVVTLAYDLGQGVGDCNKTQNRSLLDEAPPCFFSW